MRTLKSFLRYYSEPDNVFKTMLALLFSFIFIGVMYINLGWTKMWQVIGLVCIVIFILFLPCIIAIFCHLLLKFIERRESRK